MFPCFGSKILNLWRTTFLIHHVSRPEGTCSSKECKSTADMFLSHGDTEINCCDNFFDHSCGKYLPLDGKVKIPYDAQKIDAFFERREYINQKIEEFLDDLDMSSLKNSAYSNIHAFYKSCLNEDEDEQSSLNHIQEELKFYGFTMKWPFLDETASRQISPIDILARIHASSPGTSGFLFKMSIKLDEAVSSKRYIHIDSASDGLVKSSGELLASDLYNPYVYSNFFHGSRSQYIDLKRYMRQYMLMVIQKFHQHLEVELSSTENEVFEKRAKDVVDFLYELKEIRENRYVNNENEYPGKVKSMSIKKFQKLINKEIAGCKLQIIWMDFLKSLYDLLGCGQSVDAIDQSDSNMIKVNNVKEFRKTLQLLGKTSADVLVSTMWWIVIDTLIVQSAQPFKAYPIIYEMYGEIFLPVSRKRKCVNWIQEHFSLFVAHIFAIKEESKAVKEHVTEILKNVKSSFVQKCNKASWLDWKSRRAIREKLKKIHFVIGFTDSILNPDIIQTTYKEIDASKMNFLMVLSMLFKKARKKNLIDLFSEEMDMDDADLNSTEVDIMYNPHNLVIVIPITFLGFPFYDLGLDVLNYGAFGTRISLAIIKTLKLFDGVYAKREYQNLQKCFIPFYGTLHISRVEMSVNGMKTMKSNMEDSAAFKISMGAYEIRVRNEGLEQQLQGFEHYSDKQSFMRAFANTFCDNTTDEFLVYQIHRANHAPNTARVNGVLMNSQTFAKEWKCANNKWMNPKMKCPIF